MEQKVAGEEHVADLLTKNVKSEVLEKHMAEIGFTKATRRGMGAALTGGASQYSEEGQCRQESIGSVVQRKR